MQRAQRKAQPKNSTKDSAAKVQKKAVKKVQKVNKRSLHTQKKKVVAKKIAPIQQQFASLTTTTKKSPVLNKKFTTDLAQWKSDQNSSPELAPLTQAQRDIKIRSFQVAWTKMWLCRRGLYYEDIFEELDDMRMAINILPADVRKDRVRRLLRSCDLDLKLVWLPQEMQNYDPMRSYGLDDAIIRVDLSVHSHDNYV